MPCPGVFFFSFPYGARMFRIKICKYIIIGCVCKVNANKKKKMMGMYVLYVLSHAQKTPRLLEEGEE
jgi:hypothetical protein